MDYSNEGGRMKGEERKTMAGSKRQISNSVQESSSENGYDNFLGGISSLLVEARKQAGRAVNSILVATYWELGRRIVEYEQAGKRRANYGEQLLERLSLDLTTRFGKGFSRQNLQYMRQFYTAYSPDRIRQTLPGDLSALICQTVTGEFKLSLNRLVEAFPLSWSHYILLISRGRSQEAQTFYHAEALRGGWSVRQLQRQIDSQFYERVALSKNKSALLQKEGGINERNHLPPEEAIKDPYVLEFLGLKDEYSESDLEEGLIHHLETFLLELGSDFAFIARQKRLRISTEWYRVDLVFYHRRLRCLVLIDLKLGRFTHADAGQMHLYLNYAREHWTHEDENPPVGLILCSYKDLAVVKYALEGLPNKVMAAEYRTALPDEEQLAKEIEITRRRLIKADAHR